MSLIDWKFLATLGAGTPVDAEIDPGDPLLVALFKLQAQITRAGLDISVLKSNSQGVTIIDMLGDDYTATEEESKRAIILLTNVGDGSKVFTLFDAEDNPNIYLISAVGGEVGVVVGVGDPIPINTGSPILMAYFYTFGLAVDILNLYKVKATVYEEVAGTTYTLTMADLGKTLIFTSDSPVTLSIETNTNDMTFNCQIVQKGLGQITWAPVAGDMTIVNADSENSTFGQFSVVDFQGLGYGGVVLGWVLAAYGRTPYPGGGGGGLTQPQIMARISMGF